MTAYVIMGSEPPKGSYRNISYWKGEGCDTTSFTPVDLGVKVLGYSPTDASGVRYSITVLGVNSPTFYNHDSVHMCQNTEVPIQNTYFAPSCTFDSFHSHANPWVLRNCVDLGVGWSGFGSGLNPQYCSNLQHWYGGEYESGGLRAEVDGTNVGDIVWICPARDSIKTSTPVPVPTPTDPQYNIATIEQKGIDHYWTAQACLYGDGGVILGTTTNKILGYTTTTGYKQPMAIDGSFINKTICNATEHLLEPRYVGSECTFSIGGAYIMLSQCVDFGGGWKELTDTQRASAGNWYGGIGVTMNKGSTISVYPIGAGTPSIGPSPNDNSGSSGHTGALIGGVLGGVAGAVLLGVASYYGYKHYYGAHEDATETTLNNDAEYCLDISS